MTTIKKPGTTPSTSGPNGGSTTRKNKGAAGQKPSAHDEAILTGQDTKGNVSAASRSGSLQGSGSVRRNSRKTAAPSSDAESAGNFQSIAEAIGVDYNKPDGAQEAQAAAPNPAATPEAQATGQNQGASPVSADEAKQEAASAAFADMVMGASSLLGQQGVKVDPKQLANALAQANQKDPENAVQNAATALNIDPKILAGALAQSSKLAEAHRQFEQLADALSKATGKPVTAEQVAEAYAKATQDMQGGGNMFNAGQGGDIHQLAAGHLGIAPEVLRNAIDSMGSGAGQAGNPSSGGGNGGAPPPPTGGAAPGSPGEPPRTDRPTPTVINNEYMQNLQGAMKGLGINIPPEILNAQQGFMNQLYGYGLMQQSVQTQRAGLEQYLQVMNTVLQMNLSVMQNQTFQLNMIMSARQKMWAMNQQMVQNMFKTNQDASMGWIKAFSGGQ